MVERRSVIAARARAAAAAEEDDAAAAAVGVVCVGDAALAAGVESDTAAAQFLYTFLIAEAYDQGARSEDDCARGGTPAVSRSLAGLDIDVGDLVTASGGGSNGPFGLIRGAVERKGKHALVVRGDRDVTTAFGWAIAPPASDPKTRPWLWRVDRDEMTTSARVIKDNLVRFALGATLTWPDDDAPEPGAEGAVVGAGHEAAAAGGAAFDDDDDDAFIGFDFAALDAAAAAAATGQTGAAQALLARIGPQVVKPHVGAAQAASSGDSLPPGVGCGDVKRQRLLVNLDAPRFLSRQFLPWAVPPADATTAPAARTAAPTPSLQPCASTVPSALCSTLVRSFESDLNSDQRVAVDACLRARDYACILGMPGSGKTSTVAFIVRCIVAAGRTVLITSHTHSAVDTLLLKVTQGVGALDDVLRLGRPSAVHPALRRFCVEEDIASGAISAVGQLRYRLASASVVGATCLSVRHALFTSGRTFDYVIVDEASQIPEPIALGPLRAARTFLLVGDHHQLPPLVASRQAREEGMDVSLFKRLADAHPGAVFALTQQYRSACKSWGAKHSWRARPRCLCCAVNAEIQLIPNMLCYDGALKCATPSVAAGRYHLGHVPRALEALRDAVCVSGACDKSDVVSLAWLERALSSDTTVLFLDTDGVLPPEPLEPTTEACNHSRTSVAAVTAPVDPWLERRMHRSAGGDGGAGGSGLFNESEAVLVALLCHAVGLAGGSPDDIGVIAPYRAQLRLIRSLLVQSEVYEGDSRHASSTTSVPVPVSVEVETVDRYQGRDKPLIVLSCVRSNARADVGALLADVRRLNVALTRAKYRLVVVGSRHTLAGGSPLYARMLGLMEQRGWVQQLDALSGRIAAAALRTLRSKSIPTVSPTAPP